MRKLKERSFRQNTTLLILSPRFPASRPVLRTRNSAAAGVSSQRILGSIFVGLAGPLKRWGVSCGSCPKSGQVLSYSSGFILCRKDFRLELYPDLSLDKVVRVFFVRVFSEGLILGAGIPRTVMAD